MTRSYAGDCDLQTIANFLNLCETVDQLGHYYSVSEIRRDLSEPGFDPEQDVRLWTDETGQLVAYAQMWIPRQSEQSITADGFLWFRVHPTVRELGLEPNILAWGEVRIWEVGRSRHLPARLRSSCRDSQSDRILLLQNCGFVYERCFLRMERSLMEPLLMPQFPTGFTLSHSQGRQDIEARVDLHNQAFSDHWNFYPATIEELIHEETDENYRPELELLAIALDGSYAAFCCCEINREDNAQRDCQEGWIGVLGTRREFRRQGLGRAMLLAGLQKLRLEGMEVAKLGVDTENVNLALGLYESVGFRRVFANLTYVKEIKAEV
ncbi:MAG: GNAT family N-acetyltransferase [Timaviella obliquedivisa GSE-PSE-MK23-08B]|nr:GNAT family N-acetyltransferase [Timaviella obliquedivisa GSE-PSE-MK23-08B]